MPLLIWSDDYCIGIPELDAQHEQLLVILNRLYDSISGERVSRIVSDAIDELNSYTGTHFSAEEAYMQEIGYGHAESHIAEHDCFRTNVNDLARLSENDRSKISNDLIEFLWEWLLNHILVVDRKLAA